MFHQSIRKESIFNFVPIGSTDSAYFTGAEFVFSILCSKIHDAAQFCERERLDFVFLGYRNGEWQTDVSEKKLKYPVKVTTEGLSSEVYDKYIVTITDVTCL
jgi:hypothetical protein